MSKRKPKFELATGLPKPPRLTEEDLARLDEEARVFRAAVEEGTKNLDRLTADDLRIRLR